MECLISSLVFAVSATFCRRPKSQPFSMLLRIRYRAFIRRIFKLRYSIVLRGRLLYDRLWTCTWSIIELCYMAHTRSVICYRLALNAIIHIINTGYFNRFINRFHPRLPWPLCLDLYTTSESCLYITVNNINPKKLISVVWAAGAVGWGKRRFWYLMKARYLRSHYDTSFLLKDVYLCLNCEKLGCERGWLWDVLSFQIHVLSSWQDLIRQVTAITAQHD